MGSCELRVCKSLAQRETPTKVAFFKKEAVAKKPAKKENVHKKPASTESGAKKQGSQKPQAKKHEKKEPEGNEPEMSEQQRKALLDEVEKIDSRLVTFEAQNYCDEAAGFPDMTASEKKTLEKRRKALELRRASVARQLEEHDKQHAASSAPIADPSAKEEEET